MNKLIFFSESPIDHIVDNLYLGDFRAADDIEVLRKYNITHVINCPVHIPEVYKGEISYLSLNMADNLEQDLTEAINNSVAFINEATKIGGNVFIHCQQGISRSASILIAYLISSKGYSYDDALKLLCEKRNVVKPNPNFAAQLKKYENSLKAKIENNEKKEEGILDKN